MTQIVRQGDTGMHGPDPGSVTRATGSGTMDGKKVAVLGDIYTCSKHGKQPIIATGSATMDGKKVAKVGDKAACGAVILVGSPDGTLD